MTGEQFLNKVRAIKLITDIYWSIEGDVLDPDEAKIVFVADGEEIKVTYPRPGEDEFMQRVAIGLLVNKFMNQIGKEDNSTIHTDPLIGISKSIKEIRKIERKNNMIKKIVNNEDAGTVKIDEVLKMVNIENILDMLLMSDDGYQTVSVLIEDDKENKINYLMKVITAEEIVAVNKLLRSFDLGITIEFVNYAQYDLFIDYCMNLIKVKREVTA